MKNRIYSLLIICMGVLLSGCHKMPPISNLPTQRIMIGPGPEDMMLDTLHGEPRLLISCSSRRESHDPYGEIVSFNLITGDRKELIRYNEPEELIFKPHGIYLDQDILLIISHEKEPDLHPILIYRIHGDSLEFKEQIITSDQHSPNALVTGSHGEIYFVNDSGKRGSILEKALKLKRASLVRLTRDSRDVWKSEILAKGLGYPAGINRIGNRLFVGDAILHRIHVFEVSESGITPLPQIKGIKGNDNLRICDHKIITPGHVKPIKFIKHTQDPKKLSPVEVFSTDPETGEVSILFFTDGALISAGSTALIFEGHLYISQVFDSHILKIKISN